ncbi:hypothetical protein VKT23_013036 [Stygiomarasmius scandens]|uniref:CxC2-like cysteine cluster KDZ transposase-associated domain-containing protein n=1 Tax=Marasmiellus scandens TaxID=2682957 RepID=A0ABR1J725_9AGAR
MKKIDPRTVQLTAIDFQDDTFRMPSNAAVLNKYIQQCWPGLTPSSLPREECPGRLCIYAHPNMLKRNPGMPRILVLWLENVISPSAQKVYIRLFDHMRSLVKFPHLSVDANRSTMNGAIHCGRWSHSCSEVVVTRDCRSRATGGIQIEEGIEAIDNFMWEIQDDLVPAVLGAMKMEDPEMYARMIHAHKFVRATIRRLYSRDQYLETRCCLDFKGAFLCVAIKEGSSEVFHLDWQDDPNSLAWIAPLGEGWTGGDFCLPQLNIRIPIYPGQVLGAQTRRLIHCRSPVESGRRIVVTCFTDRGTLKKADQWEEVVEERDDPDVGPSPTPPTPPTTLPIFHTDYSNVLKPVKCIINVRLEPHDVSLLPVIQIAANTLKSESTESKSEYDFLQGDDADGDGEMGCAFVDDDDDDESDTENVTPETILQALKKKRTPRGVRAGQSIGSTSTWLNFYDWMEDIMQYLSKPVLDVLPLFSQNVTDVWVNHAHLPFHRIQEWDGQFFWCVSLDDLGFVLPVGHPTGQSCICAPSTPLTSLVVLDTTGAQLKVRYCSCFSARGRVQQLLRARFFPATLDNPRTVATFRLLEHFQLLSFVSKASTREYCNFLTRVTNNAMSSNVDDRYRELLRMVREWRLLKLLKRHGRGHDSTGYAGTKQGECVVRCAACPHPGINLLSDWRLAPNSKSWLYQSFICMDANFRCVRLNVSSDEADPTLNKGSSYMIDPGVAKAHLSIYDKPTDSISTCNNHKAVKLTSMRRDPGLAATGLATTDCSRHDSKLPSSSTNLTAGERYCHMDLSLLSVLHSSEVEDYVVTYDIWCQFGQRLPERILQYPEHLRPRYPGTLFVGAIPKFHLPAHQEKCYLNYNLNFTPRVGRTDGEGVERGWSVTNGLASSTKVMGPGSHSDVLDDHFGFTNWRKRTNFPQQFLLWAKENSKGREESVAAFKTFDVGIDTNTRNTWRTAMEDWEADPENYVNSYELTVKPVSFNKVRLKLAEAESQELAQSRATHAVSAEAPISSVLVEGIELRELQRRLAHKISQMPTEVTDRARSKLLEKANNLRRRIDTWYSTQALHFPSSVIVCDQVMQKCSSSSVADIPLLLPSDLLHHSTCPPSALKLQWELEYALAEDMLESIRQGLLQRTYLYKWKDRYSHGQRSSTRSSTTIAQLQERINGAAERYRITRKALASLSPHIHAPGWEKVLKELRPEHVRPLNRDDYDPILQAQALQNPNIQQVKEPSWIWCMQGLNHNGEKEMQDGKSPNSF